MATDLSLQLSRNQAIVLFEFLSRFQESGGLTIHDQAEERLLWDLLASLERELGEPLLPEYRERLAEARERVKDEQ